MELWCILGKRNEKLGLLVIEISGDGAFCNGNWCFSCDGDLYRGFWCEKITYVIGFEVGLSDM